MELLDLEVNQTSITNITIRMRRNGNVKCFCRYMIDPADIHTSPRTKKTMGYYYPNRTRASSE